MLARERDEPGETGYPRFLGDIRAFCESTVAMKCCSGKTGRDRRGIKRREKTEHATNF